MRATAPFILTSVCLVALVAALVAAAPVSAPANGVLTAKPVLQPKLSDAEFFEKKMKPLLVTHCFQCHGGGKKIKGDLEISTREKYLKGGYNGPGFVPGKPEESLSVIAIRYDDPDFEMPPAGKMSDEEIETFVEWIQRGAPWSGGPLPKPETDEYADEEELVEEEEKEQKPATPEEKEFFAKRVLPVLDKHCFRCHGGRKRVKGDLFLTTLEGAMRGGYAGPAVVPHEPEESLLVQAVRYKDPDLAMPPDYKLADLEIADLYTWIKAGAVWPEGVELEKGEQPEKK